MIMRKLGRLADLAAFYRVQRISGFDVPDLPHLDDGATERLQVEMARASFYLEFGTGGSTLAAGRAGLETIAVDSDPYFLRAVTAKLPTGHRVTPVHADIGLTCEWGWPVRGRPTPDRVRRWRTYIDKPFAMVAARGRFPDFVFVDGRFRPACALEAARLAQAKGVTVTIMIDDYVGRDDYRAVEAHLGPPDFAGRAAVFIIAPSTHSPIPEAAVTAAMQSPA
jgi:hypothetical protein